VLRLVPISCAVLVLGFVAGGCGDSEVSQADFQADVVAARNDADAGLEQIVQATSVDDLLERMRLAAIDVRGAASDVREAGAPAELEDERDALAARLLALSDEIIATVETLEAFPEQAQNTNALNFAQWNAVQAELKKLRRQGIEVPPLERHKPEIQRQ
jgi:hypothetical protein